MPALPWTSFATTTTETTYTVMASRLPLKSYWKIPSFMRMTMAIRGQLAQSDGLIGYSLATELPSKTFLTLSAWTDVEHLDAFAAAVPHIDIMRELLPHMAPTTFVTWSAAASELPISWKTARERLTAARS